MFIKNSRGGTCHIFLWISVGIHPPVLQCLAISPPNMKHLPPPLNASVLMLDKQQCYIIVGKSILCTTDVSLLPEAVVAFLVTLYLLDFDYPKQYEIWNEPPSVPDLRRHQYPKGYRSLVQFPPCFIQTVQS